MYKDIFIKHNIQKNIEYLLNILQGTYQVVYIINKQGIYIGHSVISNNSALKYGVPKMFIGKTIWDIFPKIIADKYFAFVLDTIYKDKTQILHQTYSATGTTYKELCYNEPLKDNHNNIIGVLGKIINIQELKNKTNFISLNNHDEFADIFNKLNLLLKQIEINIYNNNTVIIKKIKISLKNICILLEKSIANAKDN